MSGASNQQWGMTPPVSVELPTSDEIKLNDALMDELKNQGNFESPEATARRQEVLRHFQRVTEAFVKHVAQKRNLAPSVIENGGGKVATFGSYRLGVFGPGKHSDTLKSTYTCSLTNFYLGSDIDTLVVAPKFVTRDDFFLYFPDLLVKMSPDGAVEESTPVQDAYVPIIKMEYSGISIDLIFVHLAIQSVSPTVDLTDNTLLRGLDDTDLRSINGVRVTDEILQLVPNTKAFRQALRAVKLWAQRE
jgi:poly(A) polymerase